MSATSVRSISDDRSTPSVDPLSLCSHIVGREISTSPLRSQDTRASKRILVASQLANTEFLKGVASFARKNSWQLITDMLYTGNLPKRWDGDGILAYLPYQSEITSYVTGAETPCVTVSMTDACKSVPRIQPDDFEIGKMAAHHLIDRNCREFLWAPFFDNSQNRNRYQGFNHVIESFGCECHALPPGYLVDSDTCTDNWEEWRRAAGQALKPREYRIGVFAFNDCLSARIAHTAQELGMKFPQDLAIIGVGNDELECESASVTLSSIDPNLEKMAYLASSVLNDLIAGKALQSETIKVGPKGVIARESTALSHHGNPRVEQALVYISENYADTNLSVTKIADALEISRRQLERDFRSEKGYTVREFIEQTRMREASRLLVELPCITISDVSSLVGISASGNFFRIFRKLFGVTPSAFREQHYADSFL